MCITGIAKYGLPSGGDTKNFSRPELQKTGILHHLSSSDYLLHSGKKNKKCKEVCSSLVAHLTAATRIRIPASCQIL